MDGQKKVIEYEKNKIGKYGELSSCPYLEMLISMYISFVISVYSCLDSKCFSKFFYMSKKILNKNPI